LSSITFTPISLAKHGIKNYYRARCFNDDANFPRVLQSIVKEAYA
jgi:protoheme ferro-lyase